MTYDKRSKINNISFSVLEIFFADIEDVICSKDIWMDSWTVYIVQMEKDASHHFINI